MNRSRKQWVTLSAVLFIALLAQMSVAETVIPRKGKGKKSRTTASTSTSSETVSSPAQSKFPIDLSVGPDMMIVSGTSGFGFSVHAVTPVSHSVPIYVGLESGMDFGLGGINSSQTAALGNEFGGAVTGGGLTVLHLLGTGIYKLSIPNAKTIHPYFGVSVGPAFAFGSAVTIGGIPVSGTGGTDVYFEALLRTGVAFDISPTVALNVEPKIGIFDGNFMFRPVVSASFML